MSAQLSCISYVHNGERLDVVVLPNGVYVCTGVFAPVPKYASNAIAQRATIVECDAQLRIITLQTGAVHGVMSRLYDNFGNEHLYSNPFFTFLFGKTSLQITRQSCTRQSSALCMTLPGTDKWNSVGTDATAARIRQVPGIQTARSIKNAVLLEPEPVNTLDELIGVLTNCAKQLVI